MSTQINKSEFHEIYNKTYNSILKFIAVKCQNVEDINDILQDTYTELYKILNKRTIIEVESEVAFIIGIAKKILKRYFSFKYKYQLLSYSLNTDELEIDVQDKFDLEQDIITKNNAEEIWYYLNNKNLMTSKIFYLYFCLDMKISEIAKELNLKESTDKNKIYRKELMIMINKALKDYTEEKFDKDKNYEKILQKVDNKKITYNNILKYSITTICLVFAIAVGTKLNDEYLISKETNETQKNPEIAENNDIIKINDAVFQANSLDIDAKFVEKDLNNEFDFIKNIYIPDYCMENFEQGEIYVRENIEDDDYSKLYQYSVTYYMRGGQYIEDSCINIEFSKNEILHCLYYNMEEVEESIINNVPVKIFAYKKQNDESKIGGYASFKYNDYNFDIEVNMINLEDFIKIVKSIIK